MMIKFIYRFRSIDKVLSNEDLEGVKGFDELRKQQIYLATTKELNDPMEGYKEIYWKGDEIAWRNLIKHYLRCLENTYYLGLLKDDLSGNDIDVFKKYGDFPTKNYRNLVTKICDSFFSNEIIAKYPKLLSEVNHPIRKSQISMLLHGLHQHAIKSIHDIYHSNGLLPNKLILPDLDQNKCLLKENDFATLNHLEQKHRDKPYDAVKTISDVSNNIRKELNLILKYKNRNQEAIKKKSFILCDFTDTYLKQIEQLLYPEPYIACFSNNYENASMWSHYAGNHEGICFQFKTNNQQQFDLTRNSNTHQKTSYPLHSVKYQKKFPEIDFFQSLGNLPISHLREFWFAGEDKKQSNRANFLYPENEEEWRKKYWESYSNILNTKTIDWEYEDECRIISYSTIGDKVSVANYNFNDLQGIIFGINTKSEYKIKIMEIIEEKCQATSRKDFKFYQANYCPDNGNIKKQELTFLKFK